MYKALRELMKEDFIETENNVNERVATDMLKDGKPLSEIIRYSRLAKDVILGLANSIGVAVVQ